MCNTMVFAYGVLTPHRTNLIVGVSIVIGAIGGVYLLQRGARYFCQLTEKKPRKKPDDICNVCFTKLDVEDFKSCVTCCNCQKFVCRGRQCTIWIPSQAGWECQLCSLSSESRSRASEWLHQQINEKYLRPMSSRSNPSIPTKDYCNDFDTNSEAPSSYCSEQREKVRGYVEEALSQILGGSLDNVSVSQMFKSQESINPLNGNNNHIRDTLRNNLRNASRTKKLKLHKKLLNGFKTDLPLWESEECPGVSHVKLKRLIEKIIQETLRLPALFDYSGIPGRTEENLPFFDPKKYQELLATAVLNKIVDSYNYEKKFELGNNNEDLDKNHNPIITAKNKIVSQSSSSIEPGSDSSITDTAVNIGRDDDAYPSDTDSNLHSDLVTGSVQTGDESVLSDYVARHQVPLPELSLDTESPDDDIMSVATTRSTEGNWEDNWLFKKKKRGNEATASVGMLVPSPREDIRTLIGDKTADEVSDLSEGSDFEDNECNDMKTQNDTDLPNVLIQNKNVIGGKSTVGLFDELLEQTSMISTTSIQDGEAAFTECKNEHVLNDEGLNDVAAPPKLDLSNNNAQIVVESEAINSHVNSEIFSNGAASQHELLVLSPPEHFEDTTETRVTETSSEQNNETETNLDSLEQAQINENIEEEINTNQNTNTNTNISSKNEIEASPGVEKGRRRSLDISTKIVTDVIENASTVKLLAALALTPLIAPITSDDCMESHIPEIPCHHESQRRDTLEGESVTDEIVLISVNKKDDEIRVKSPDIKKVTFAESTSCEGRSAEVVPAERKELLTKMGRYSESDDWQDDVDAKEHLLESEPSDDKDVILQLLLQAPPGFEDAASQIHPNLAEEVVESAPVDTAVLSPIIPNKSEQHAEEELMTCLSEDAKLEEISKPDLSNMSDTIATLNESDNAEDLCPQTQKTEHAPEKNIEHPIEPVLDGQNEESLCVDREQTFNASTNSSSLQDEAEKEKANSAEKRNPCLINLKLNETPAALPEQKMNLVEPDLDNQREESPCSHDHKEKHPSSESAASQEEKEKSVDENFTNIHNIAEASNSDQKEETFSEELIPSDPITQNTNETEVPEGQAHDDQEQSSDQQVSDSSTTSHEEAETSNNKSSTEIQNVTEKEESLSHDDNEQFSEERKLDEEVENSEDEANANIQNVTESEEATKPNQEEGVSSEELIPSDSVTPADSSPPIDNTVEIANTQNHEEVESPDQSKEGPVINPYEESAVNEINDALECIILQSPPGFGDERNLSYEVGSMLPVIEEEGIEGSESEITDQDVKVSEEDITVDELSVPDNETNKSDESISVESNPEGASEVSHEGIESVEKSSSQPAQASHSEESVGSSKVQDPNDLNQEDFGECNSNEHMVTMVLDPEKLEAEVLETTTMESLQINEKVKVADETRPEELVSNDTEIQCSKPASEGRKTDCMIPSCEDEVILPPMEFEDVTIEDMKPADSLSAEELLQNTEPSSVPYEEVELPPAQSESQDVPKDDAASTENMVVAEELLENFHNEANTTTGVQQNSELSEESVIQLTEAPENPTEEARSGSVTKVEDSLIVIGETHEKSLKPVEESSDCLADISLEIEKEAKTDEKTQDVNEQIPTTPSREMNCSLNNEQPAQAISASDHEELVANNAEESIEPIETSVSQDVEKDEIPQTVIEPSAKVLPESGATDSLKNEIPDGPSSIDGPSKVAEDGSDVELLDIVDVRPPSEFENEVLAVKDSENEFPSEHAETSGKIQRCVEPLQQQKIEKGSGDGKETANRQQDSPHTNDAEHERRPSVTQSSEIVGSAKKGSRRASLKRDSAIERELEETLRDFDKTILSFEEENQFLSIGSQEEVPNEVKDTIEGTEDKVADVLADVNPLTEINQSKDDSSPSLAEDTLNPEPEASGEMSVAKDAGNAELEVKEIIDSPADLTSNACLSETDSSASKDVLQSAEESEVKDEKENVSCPEIDLEDKNPGLPTEGIHDDKQDSENNEKVLGVEPHPTKAEIAEIAEIEAINEETIVTPSQEQHSPNESVYDNETEYTKLECSTENVLQTQNEDPSDICRTVSPATFIKENMDAITVNIECSSPLDSLILEPPPENLCSSPLHTLILLPAPPATSEESETELEANVGEIEGVEDSPETFGINQENSSEAIVAESSADKTESLVQAEILVDSDFVKTEKSSNSSCPSDDPQPQDNICVPNPGQTHEENDEEVEKIEEGDAEKFSTTEVKQPTEAELQETNIQEYTAPAEEEVMESKTEASAEDQSVENHIVKTCDPVTYLNTSDSPDEANQLDTPTEMFINLQATVDSKQCKEEPVQEQVLESTDQDILPEISTTSQQIVQQDIKDNTHQEIQPVISEPSQDTKKEGIPTEASKDKQPTCETNKEKKVEESSDQAIQAEISEPPPKIKEDHTPKESSRDIQTPIDSEQCTDDSIQNQFQDSSDREAEAKVSESLKEVREEDTSEQIAGDHQTAVEQCKEESISNKVQESGDIESKAETLESLQEVKAEDSTPEILTDPQMIVESEQVQDQFGESNHNEAMAEVSDDIPNVQPVTAACETVVEEADQADVAPTVPGATADSVPANENESQETCEVSKEASAAKYPGGTENLTFVADSPRAVSPLSLMRQISMEVALNLESCFSELDSLVLSPPPRELCSSPLESLIVVPPPPDMDSLDEQNPESDPGKDGCSDGKVDKSPNKLETSDAKSLQPLGDNAKPITNIDMKEIPNPPNVNDDPTKSDTSETTSFDENKDTKTSTQEIVQTEIKSQSAERNDPNETTCNKITEIEMSGSSLEASPNPKPKDPDLSHHHGLMNENETNDLSHNASIFQEAKECMITLDHSSKNCGIAASEISEEPTDGGEQSKGTKSSEGADTSNTSGSGDPPNNQSPSDHGTPTGSEGNGSGGNEDEDSKKNKKKFNNEQPEQSEDDSHENEDTNTLLQIKESEAMEERRFSYSTIGQLDVEFGEELTQTPTPKRSVDRNAELIANNLRDELLNSEQEQCADLVPESISVELNQDKPTKCDGVDSTSNELRMCTDSIPESSVNELQGNENEKFEELSQVELPKRDGKEIGSTELEKCIEPVPESLNKDHAESESSASESLHSENQTIICSDTEIPLNDQLSGGIKDKALTNSEEEQNQIPVDVSAIVEYSSAVEEVTSKGDTKNNVSKTYCDTTVHEGHKTISETPSPDSLLRKEIINDEISESSTATPLDEKQESPKRTESTEIAITESIIESNEVKNVQIELFPKLTSEPKVQDKSNQDGLIIVREETIPATLEFVENASSADDSKVTLSEFINETSEETERNDANKSESMLVPDCNKSINQVPLAQESVENDQIFGDQESSSDTHIEESESNGRNEEARSDNAIHTEETQIVQADLQDSANEAAANNDLQDSANEVETVEEIVNKESEEIGSTIEQCQSLAQGSKSYEENDKIKSDTIISSEENENVLQKSEVTINEASVVPDSKSDTRIQDGKVGNENHEVKDENAFEEQSNPKHVEGTKCENLAATKSRRELNKSVTETHVELESSNNTPDTKNSGTSRCKIFVQSPSEEDGEGTITEIESNVKSEKQPSTSQVPEEQPKSVASDDEPRNHSTQAQVTVEVDVSIGGPNQEQTDLTEEEILETDIPTSAEEYKNNDETPKSESLVESVLGSENVDHVNTKCTAEPDEATSHSKSDELTEITMNEQCPGQFNDVEKEKPTTESQKENEDLEKPPTNPEGCKTDNYNSDDSHRLQINTTATIKDVADSDSVEHKYDDKALENSQEEGNKSEEPNIERSELQISSITDIVKETDNDSGKAEHEDEVSRIHTNEDTESEDPKAQVPLDEECSEVQTNAVKDDRHPAEPQVGDGLLETPCEKDSEEPDVESHEEQANTITNIMEEADKDSGKPTVEDLIECDEGLTCSIEPHAETKETSPSDISEVKETEQSNPNDASTESENQIETPGVATDTTTHLQPNEAENETTKEKRLRQLKIKAPSMIIAREESKTGSSLGISHQHTVDLPVIIPKMENMAKAAMNSSSETTEVTPNITTEIEMHKELPTNLETVESTQDTSIPTNKTTNSSDSGDSINSQKHQKLETLKNTTFSKHLGQEENAHETLGHLLPGSIAERERLKWYSAVEMPNNPYSPEALKQRLSIGSEKPIDIPNISTSIDLTSSQDMPNQIDETAEGASKLQIVIGAHKPDQRRYGRDYYINEAKYANIIASGGSESVKETEKLSSTLSLNNEDQHTENKVKQYSTESTTNSSNSSVRRSSSGSEKPSLENCDLFTARPVRVEESDPILNKAIKLEYLSTPERDFYLLPSEEVENLKTPNQSDTSSQLSQNLDSLTASEDSDTIRVYDLNNQETRIIKDEKLKENLEPDITKQRPNILSLTPKVGQQTQQQQAQKKIITPTSLKFLQPKRKLFDPRRIMSVDSGLKSPIFDNSPMMISTSSLDSPDKTVIEEELISALPSVKALAKAFSINNDSTPVTPVYKSKATTLNSVEVKSPEPIHEEIHEEVIEETSQPTEVVESVVSVTQEEPVEHLNEVTEANEIVQEFETLLEAEENHVEEHHPEIEIIVNVQKHDSLFESSNERSPPERPISPVLVPGLLKNNIAFFENLKNK